MKLKLMESSDEVYVYIGEYIKNGNTVFIIKLDITDTLGDNYERKEVIHISPSSISEMWG